MDERPEPNLEISPARAKLLEALGRIELAEEEMGGPIQYVTVVFSGTFRDEDGDLREVGGTVGTDEPPMFTATMLREAADLVEHRAYCQAPAEDE